MARQSPRVAPSRRTGRTGRAGGAPRALANYCPRVLTVGGWLRYPIVRRLIPAGARTVLEIGRGRGAMGAMLAREYDYRGIEPDPQSFDAAQSLLSGRITQATDPYATGQFDVVCAFEVLEHIEDDLAALKRWRQLVAPDGCLIMSVPAHQRLYSRVDERVGHFRRYDRDQLTELLERAGFGGVDQRANGMGIGHAIRWASLLAAHGGGSREQRTAESGRWMQPTSRTAVARRLLAAPFSAAQHPLERTSLGTGIVAAAHR